MTIKLPLPIDGIESLRVKAIYPDDGEFGSVVFDALDAHGAIVGQPARGALLTEEPKQETVGEIALDAAVLALHDE